MASVSQSVVPLKRARNRLENILVMTNLTERTVLFSLLIGYIQDLAT